MKIFVPIYRKSKIKKTVSFFEITIPLRELGIQLKEQGYVLTYRRKNKK